MKIVVTGGAGFIGSHITELLCDKKHSVKVIDNLSFGYERFIDNRAQFIKGDINDEKLLKRVLKGADAVVHLAASSIIKFSYDNPLSYFENNLINGVKLLDAMRINRVSKIINSSTAAVYGNPRTIPVKEDDFKEPMNTYGASKLAFEEALCAYYHAYGIDSVSLRYFNAYGPRDEQKPATRAVPMWMKAIITNKPVEMYWNGKQIRDYIFVKDIAKAHIDVLKLRGLHYYNIGSGNGIMMKNIITTIEKIAGKKLKTIDKGERKGDPAKLVADISKIKREVSWEPRTTLFEGLQKTFEYYNQTLSNKI
ncbi:MAG TPA: GDP-mannose 4,6-dehydratase [Candidatus Acidoferrales bacterium]|nr:GDP-mannose 4,6-dehydratase [Candidatus Acidoferrales bacterium]